MSYKDFSLYENMISLRVKINLISSHVKISMTSYAPSGLPLFTKFKLLNDPIYFYMIERSSKIALKYPATFGNLRKF